MPKYTTTLARHKVGQALRAQYDNDELADLAAEIAVHDGCRELTATELSVLAEMDAIVAEAVQGKSTNLRHSK